MAYDFDKVTDRTGTSCIKYDFQKERRGREDLIPLWVADMDFPLPKEVLAPLRSRIDHGIFGYTDPKDDYYSAVLAWFKNNHGWEGKKEWICVTPGVVCAIAIAIRAFTHEGDSVIINQPVYYPFSEAINDNNRKLVNSELVYSEGRYSIDFEDFERKIIENDVKLYILCSPHNPVGRVWSREELTKVGEICKRHGVLIVSDEIHCDFIYEGYRHTSFIELGEEFYDSLILCTAPSKTFNIAGFQASNIFIPDSKLRGRFKKEYAAAGLSQPNIMCVESVKAVYKYGYDWYKELLKYISANLEFVRDYIAEKIPGIRLVEPEGTYLIWLDCRGLGLDNKELETFIEDKAGLWVDFGSIFGEAGDGFIRINIACPRKTLIKAFEQLEKAVITLA